MDQEKDNTDLPVPEGSTASTSGQKYIGKHPLMTEQESDSKPPLGKEDGHVSNNADALVTGPRLLTPPVSYVASNSNPEKKSSENEVVSGDDFGITLEKLKEEIKRLQLSEISLMEENEELKLDKNFLVEELDRQQQQQQIKKILIEFVKSTEDKAHTLMQELEAGSFGREEPRVPKTAVERQNEENKEELKALVQKQWEIKGDSSAPAAAACGGDSKGQNYELPDAESSSSASEPSPSAPLSVAAPVNDNLYDCIKLDATDFKMMRGALMAASFAEILEHTENLPSVGCVIRGFTLNHLPGYSLGWNGFIANTDKKDLDAVKSLVKPEKPTDRTVAKHLCLHAEVQALNSYRNDLRDATAYVTHSPCLDCAKRLIHHGISRVLYLFWLNGCESTIKLFERRDITCMAFPHRELLLRGISRDFLTENGINRGGTNTDKLPRECLSFVSSKEYKQK